MMDKFKPGDLVSPNRPFNGIKFPQMAIIIQKDTRQICEPKTSYDIYLIEENKYYILCDHEMIKYQEL